MKTTDLAERPKCKCGAYLEIRTSNGSGSTSEQKFCGVWYDHPKTSPGSEFGHTTTVLYPSMALLHQIGATT